MSNIRVDIEQPTALLTYLRQIGRIGTDEQPLIQPLTGGVSNRTVWVERPSGEAWVLKQALEKLRVAVDWFSSPERAHREALGLQWLAELTPPCSTPALIFEDDQQHIVAMQAIPQPHRNWKEMLLAGQLDLKHVAQFAHLLGIIHRNSSARRTELEPIFADRTFFESLRLEPYYGYTAQQVPAAADFLHGLIEETRPLHLALVHGDYSPKNVLVYDERLILLDYEVIHFGDPAFDLGFSLTHFLSKAHHLPSHRAAFIEAAALYWQQYLTTLGEVAWLDTLEARVVRHTLGCLLARVAGRSPLEYLTPAQRDQQRLSVVNLMALSPRTIPALLDQFTRGVTYYDQD
jgi:aminoglycoside phosphotransferase (APT) family kinase protein